jgi:murein DD-endopeptidase MepM/ murein hydrolase activator NlpD
MELLFPIKGAPSISQKFGNKFELYSDWHHGVDFRTWQYKNAEDKKVLAALEGKVIKVDKTSTGNTYYKTGKQGSSYGVHCVIEFEEGGAKYYTLYGHMAECFVSVGDTVKVGQELGIAGNSGLSTRDHLHFEIRKGSNLRSKAINPTAFFTHDVPDDIPEWGREAWEWNIQHEIMTAQSSFEKDGRTAVFLFRLAKKIMGWVNALLKEYKQQTLAEVAEMLETKSKK